jgi:hypothetical protein
MEMDLCGAKNKDYTSIFSPNVEFNLTQNYNEVINGVEKK